MQPMTIKGGTHGSHMSSRGVRTTEIHGKLSSLTKVGKDPSPLPKTLISTVGETKKVEEGILAPHLLGTFPEDYHHRLRQKQGQRNGERREGAGDQRWDLKRRSFRRGLGNGRKWL